MFVREHQNMDTQALITHSKHTSSKYEKTQDANLSGAMDNCEDWKNSRANRCNLMMTLQQAILTV